MNQQAEWIWLDPSQTVTLSELSRCCGLSLTELDELVDYSALIPLHLTPLNHVQDERVFSAEWVTPLRTASKLRREFDLDLFTIAIVLGHLNRIDTLERQVLSLQAHLPG